MIDVVCAILEKNGQVLIAKRRKSKSLGGKWEFPGGKIQEGEEEVDALKRELKEEMGIEIHQIIKLGSNIHQYEDLSINLIAYRCSPIIVPTQSTDHDEMIWISPAELKSYDLAEADIPLIDLYLR